jgi:ribosomal-protein-alanine N-acetyltransferase
LPPIQIRTAHLNDLPQVERIEISSFPDPYPQLLFETLLAHSPETFLVAVEEGSIVGYVCSTKERTHFHIASIAVQPSHRRKKIARELMEALLKILRNMGSTFVRLEVRSSNTPAINLYKGLDFKHTKTLKSYYEDGEDAVVMVLNLRYADS